MGHSKDYQRAWYRKNLEKVRTKSREQQRRKRAANPGAKYGLTRSEYDALVEKQHKACAVCGRAKKLDVDHNHVTNRVRGLLCRRCNVAIAALGDNAVGLRLALEYLERTDGVQ